MYVGLEKRRRGKGGKVRNKEKSAAAAACAAATANNNLTFGVLHRTGTSTIFSLKTMKQTNALGDVVFVVEVVVVNQQLYNEVQFRFGIHRLFGRCMQCFQCNDNTGDTQSER